MALYTGSLSRSCLLVVSILGNICSVWHSPRQNVVCIVVFATAYVTGIQYPPRVPTEYRRATRLPSNPDGSLRLPAMQNKASRYIPERESANHAAFNAYEIMPGWICAHREARRGMSVPAWSWYKVKSRDGWRRPGKERAFGMSPVDLDHRASANLQQRRAPSATGFLRRLAISVITRSHLDPTRPAFPPSPPPPHPSGAVPASPFSAAVRTCRGDRRCSSWISL